MEQVNTAAPTPSVQWLWYLSLGVRELLMQWYTRTRSCQRLNFLEFSKKQNKPVRPKCDISQAWGKYLHHDNKPTLQTRVFGFVWGQGKGVEGKKQLAGTLHSQLSNPTIYITQNRFSCPCYIAPQHKVKCSQDWVILLRNGIPSLTRIHTYSLTCVSPTSHRLSWHLQLLLVPSPGCCRRYVYSPSSLSFVVQAPQGPLTSWLTRWTSGLFLKHLIYILSLQLTRGLHSALCGPSCQKYFPQRGPCGLSNPPLPTFKLWVSLSASASYSKMLMF